MHCAHNWTVSDWKLIRKETVQRIYLIEKNEKHLLYICNVNYILEYLLYSFLLLNLTVLDILKHMFRGTVAVFTLFLHSLTN
jgi:hypothetical protein